jgi:hypothetical protein
VVQHCTRHTAGVAAEVICLYVDVDQAAMDGCTASPKRNLLRRKRCNLSPR